MARYIGVDLHRNCFTVCTRGEAGNESLREWRLNELGHFVKRLKADDEVAVEVTGNSRLFHDMVAPQVARVALVNPNQFKVINQSVKKTDANDAQLLALFLAKGLLPEVRLKDKAHVEVASLTQTRDKLVKLRTTLKNKINNILSARGVNLPKEALSSDGALSNALATL